MSKTLDRISKLLAMAEGAGSDEERDAFNAKAQSLASVAGVELELARQHQADKTKRETPTVERFIIGERGKKNNAALCNLFMRIGEVNDLKFTIAHNSTFVNCYGFPSDIEVTKALYASLLLQMVEAAEKGIKAGKHKEETFWSETTYTYRTDARVWRAGFYSGFTSEIGRRLRQAKEDVENSKVKDIFFGNEVDDEDIHEVASEEEGESTGALVLKAKRLEVHDFYKANNNARGSWKGGSGRNTNVGSSHGRAAGQSARLGAPRAISNPRAVSAA